MCFPSVLEEGPNASESLQAQMNAKTEDDVMGLKALNQGKGPTHVDNVFYDLLYGHVLHTCIVKRGYNYH